MFCKGLGLTLVLLTVKHMMCPQKPSEQEEVNTKVGGKAILATVLKRGKAAGSLGDQVCFEEWLVTAT